MFFLFHYTYIYKYITMNEENTKLTTVKILKDVYSSFKKVSFTESDFRGRKTTRLAQLSYLQEIKQVDNQMRVAKA